MKYLIWRSENPDDYLPTMAQYSDSYRYKCQAEESA